MNHLHFPLYNIGYLCTDWQVEQSRGDNPALIWVSNNLESTTFTFSELQNKSNQVANLLKKLNIHPEEKLMILLPRIPELFFFFLGALKAGMNTCILFTSIGEETLKDRILDSKTDFIVTNNSLLFKFNAIINDLPKEFKILNLEKSNQNQLNNMIDISDFMEQENTSFESFPARRDQVSHFHFTSGSTGKPKGVQHVHGSAESIAASFIEVIQPEPNDIYWCTADQGWVTGVSYGIIGPWINGITQLQFEGNFKAESWMSILEKYHVNILYSAPTVFRMLMQNQDSFFQKFDYSSLKRIYCVGEPLNPVIIEWVRRVLRKEIFDTWFQTETGSIMISNHPGLAIRPGSMGKPLSYINVAILDKAGNPLPPLKEGLLCIEKNWSSMFIDYINHSQTYQDKFIGNYYDSGDIAYKDPDGYYWFIGRNDDVINTAGHLVSPFEVESALLELNEILDVGVVGVPDNVLFERVIAFVVLRYNDNNLKQVQMKMKIHVANKVSSIASPQEIIFVEAIPKTKSGKIMRRILRNQYLNLNLGDLSTLEEY